MIPKRILLLPCGHVLCQSCHAASSQESVGRCPLDQEPFDDAECSCHDFPARRANVLRVYCWNEPDGCQFEGSVEDMLCHYENDCTFHVIECLRCGEGVLHRDLSGHRMTGCTGGVSSASAETASSVPTAVTLQEVTSALDDLKALIMLTNHDQLLPAIQSQMNELTEQVRSQENKFAAITREVGASVEAEIASKLAVSEQNLKTKMLSITDRISSRIAQLESLQNRSEEASASSSAESMFILRKLEHFASRSFSTVEEMRRICSKRDANCVVTSCELQGSMFCSSIPRMPSTLRKWGEMHFTEKYIVTLENCDSLLLNEGRMHLAQIRVLHTRDAYFSVEVYNIGGFPLVEIEFFGMFWGRLCPEPSFLIGVYEWERGHAKPLPSSQSPCCDNMEGSWLHYHGKFGPHVSKSKRKDFLRDGKMKLEIMISHKESTQPRQ